MFRTSRVRHQEDHLYMQFCMICFSCVYVSSLAGGRMCWIIVSQCTLQKKHEVSRQQALNVGELQIVLARMGKRLAHQEHNNI